MHRSLEGLKIHQENKLEKLQSSKFIKWYHQSTTPPRWLTAAPASPPPSAALGETLSVGSPVQDLEPANWQLSLDTLSPTLWPAVHHDHPQQPLFAEETNTQPLYTEETTTQPLLDMEMNWIIDYLLDDRKSPDMEFPAECSLPVLQTIDRGE